MKEKRGIVLTLLGGTMWGFSGACSQFLFTHYTIAPLNLTAMRMLFAGVILVTAGFLVKRREMATIFKNRHDTMMLVAFAIFGLTACQFTYLAAINASNAGTATVLQYLFPLYIMIISCVLSRRLPRRREAIAIVLAIGGTFLLATHGNITAMALTKAGLFWGIVSSLTCVSYSLLPRGLMKTYGSLMVTGYGMLIGGIAVNIVAPVYKMSVSFDLAGLLALAGVIIVGTALAFTLYLQGVNEIGPVKASMLASVEPVSATAFAFFWLKTSFQLVDFLGITMIVTMIILLALPEKTADQ